MNFLFGVVVGVIGLLIWKRVRTPNDGKVVMDVLKTLQDAQENAVSEEATQLITRQQRAKLRACLRDHMNVKRGLEKDYVRLEILEEALSRAIRTTEEQD
jgi:uncharacterized membrane protein YccC